MGCFNSKNNKTFIYDSENNAYNGIYWRSNEDCCICMERKSNMLLLPCSHLVICDECTRNNIQSGYKLCPICQQEVYSYNLLKIIPAKPVY